jgi:hypothetical protein
LSKPQHNTENKKKIKKTEEQHGPTKKPGMNSGLVFLEKPLQEVLSRGITEQVGVVNGY